MKTLLTLLIFLSSFVANAQMDLLGERKAQLKYDMKKYFPEYTFVTDTADIVRYYYLDAVHTFVFDKGKAVALVSSYNYEAFDNVVKAITNVDLTVPTERELQWYRPVILLKRGFLFTIIENEEFFNLVITEEPYVIN